MRKINQSCQGFRISISFSGHILPLLAIKKGWTTTLAFETLALFYTKHRLKLQAINL